MILSDNGYTLEDGDADMTGIFQDYIVCAVFKCSIKFVTIGGVLIERSFQHGHPLLICLPVQVRAEGPWTIDLTPT
ncbi:MAG: hypothetical protein Q8N94_04520 [Methanoregula sp.]|nr:hypothetical protein [Methanoregula sp.]